MRGFEMNGDGGTEYDSTGDGLGDGGGGDATGTGFGDGSGDGRGNGAGGRPDRAFGSLNDDDGTGPGEED
jgi:hypothetical protein